MTDAILVLNAGSSSLKYAIYDLATPPESLARGQVDRIGQAPVWTAAGGAPEDLPEGLTSHAQVLAWLTERLRAEASDLRIVAGGHRVVHGGQEFTAPMVIDDTVLTGIHALEPLAPGHQPHNIAGIEALMAAYPGIPQVACFDTAFHRTQPRLAQLFAIPRDLSDAGVLRYGFHGLSYDYIASRLPEALPDRAEGRVVVLHLGNGASGCAMLGRKSRATTMGFTALDGLMMGSRCGDIDPGVLIHLIRTQGLDADALDALLGKQSGLKGVSGIGSDMRDLLASDAPEAAEAVDLFAYRAGLSVAQLAAAVGGLDALVFTAGIGEHAPEVRRRICAHCDWLGVGVDDAANGQNALRIDSPGSAVQVAVIPTNEEQVIAERTRALIG